MKKIISLILCAVLVFSSCAVLASGATISKEDWNGYPVILVPGYSSTVLVDTDTGEQVWGIDFDKIIPMLLSEIVNVSIGLGEMAFGNPDRIAGVVGNGLLELCGKISCNPDGTSTYNLERIRTEAEELQLSVLKRDYPDGTFQWEPEMSTDITSYIGEDNFFVFNCDFRMNSAVCASQLNDFIESVKEFTGKDKVNLFAVSHGGQTTATYIALYGGESLAKVVMTIPAIGGAGLAYDILADEVHLDEECLVRYLQYGLCVESDFDWLVKAQQLGFLDKVLKALVPYLHQVLGYWGSMWDFVPADKYEQVKALRLNAEESAPLIAASDRFHNELLPSVSSSMKQAIAEGTDIAIIAGTGNRIVSGLNESSDGIITVSSSTGATVAPLGERFADGYSQINDCNGKYKVSPSMTVDASTAYLPDNTWFVEGYFHGMTYYDDYTRTLLYTLLLTDKIDDVYTDKDYPQFHDSTSQSLSVYGEFTGCTPGYLTSDAKTLKVTNICKKAIVTVQAVTVDGIDLTFKVPANVLKPGESVEIPFSGQLPEESKREFDLNICYIMSNVTPQSYRTQGFTLMNGEDVNYDGGYVNHSKISLDNFLSDKLSNLLSKLGLNEFFSMIFNIIRYRYLLISNAFVK